MSRRILVSALLAATITGCATSTTPSFTTSTTHVADPAGPPNTTPGETTTAEEEPLTEAEDDEALRQARERMVEDQIEARGVSDATVLEAMRAVPRHRFVPPEYHGYAYADHPLPIGYGQTISQPYMVAWMSEMLEARPGAKVLEIGTGSGYQAAILAAMGVDVYTVEIIPELAESAASRLDQLGYDVHVLQADGYFGWSEHAPYDAIVVTAAPDHLPQPLLDQLAIGGHLVIPVGPVGSFQTMWRFTIDDSGEPLAENFGYVSFVPLTRDEEGGSAG